MSQCLSLFEFCHSSTLPLFQMTSYLCAAFSCHICLAYLVSSLLSQSLCVCDACNIAEFTSDLEQRECRHGPDARGWCTHAVPKFTVLALNCCATPGISLWDQFRKYSSVQLYFLLACCFSFLTYYTMIKSKAETSIGLALLYYQRFMHKI